MSKNKQYTRIGLVFIIIILTGVFFALSNASPSDINTQGDMDAMLTALPRTNREGYNVIEEQVMVNGSREFLGVSSIENEQLFYVKAGYWIHTNTLPIYRNDADHPIFIYTVQGELTGGSMYDLLLGPPSSNPNAPTPEYRPPTAATIAMDAVTGDLLYFTDQYTADISLDLITVSHAELLENIATLEALIPVSADSVYPETTQDVLPLPTQDIIPLPSAP